MEFKNKVIFIISYEEWGDMLMSKHHYAIELARLGNEVYFINHTDKRKRLKRGEIRVVPTSYRNLFSVEHRLVHPYFLKSKATFLYNFLTDFHIKAIKLKIRRNPDVVWSFDTGNSLPLTSFTKRNLKIYMPVDGPFGTIHEIRAAEKADVIFSVANDILDAYKLLPLPRYRLNHGVSEIFISEEVNTNINTQIKVGYSGSLLRSDIDTSTFLKIIRSHSDKIFEFWGEYEPEKSSIHLPHDVSRNSLNFIEELKLMPNVILHGAVNPQTLAAGLQTMDALIVCYNIRNLQNTHKVLEYLGSGKTIISSYIGSYINRPELIDMVTTVDDNSGLPALFDKVINDLQSFNSLKKQQQRIGYAKEHTYLTQVARIEKMLQENIS